jgi:hypothetical protein
MRPFIYIVIGLLTYLAAYKLLFKDFAHLKKRGWDMITIWPIAIIILTIRSGQRLSDEDYPPEFSWRIIFWLISGVLVVSIVSRLIY